MLLILYTAVLLLCLHITSAKIPLAQILKVRGGSGGSDVESNDAFEEIGQYLLKVAAQERKSGKKDKKRKSGKHGVAPSPWDAYEERHVMRTLNKLAGGQAALKTMDGATHRFRNAFSDGASSLEARYENFLSSEDAVKTKKGRKEAGKLYEYVSAIERFFQGSEILQAASQGDDATKKEWFYAAGLEEVSRVVLTVNKMSVVMYVLKPVKDASASSSGDAGSGEEGKSAKFWKTKPRAFAEDDTVLAFVEAASDSRVSLSQVLSVMEEEPLSLPLSAVGFVQEEVCLQPTFLECARLAMQRLSAGVLTPEAMKYQQHVEPSEEDGTSVAREDADAAAAADVTEGNEENHDEEALAQQQQQRYKGNVRIFGYSSGAAVGAYVGMMLEGTLDTADLRANPVPALKGAFKKQMSAVLVAPPPCLSRSIVSPNIISLVCGDDVVPRAAPDSIARLRRRVLKALHAGAGKSGLTGLKYTAKAGFLGDLKAVTGKSMKTYASGEHDLSSLRVPGRVFFLKARAHKDGASLQRVMRGNWREDMLWQLNEVLLSDRMLRHHELDYHIATLDRL
jgi:hypothetical protein